MQRYGVTALAVALLAMLWIGTACGETRLAGVSIGQSPRSLMDSKSYGPPSGMITQPLTFNPMAPLGPPVAGYSLLPAYAKAVAPSSLAAGQLEWVYSRGHLALGFIFSGRGNDAQISDIIVSVWNQETARRPNIRTEQGIGLGDSFRSVLLRYGWPPLVQTLRAASTASLGLGTPGMMLPPASRPAVGLSSLPPVTTVQGGEATAAVGLGTQSFTQHCILGYPGVTFTLYKMKVVSIHIYEPTAPAATGPAPTTPVAAPGAPPAAAAPAGSQAEYERMMRD